MKNCVYVLCCKDKRYYIGSTVDLNKRIREHRQGKVWATRKRRPVKLVLSQEYRTKHEAHRLELWIKSQKSRKLIDQIIEENVIRKKL